MNNGQKYDVVIIGGSYAGLSAAMALGRAGRVVMVIDNDKACNRQTPHSHNFITQDGEAPAVIKQKALAQVAAYPTIQFFNGQAVAASGTDGDFEVVTESETVFTAKKLILATGVQDIPLPITGFAECWGISVLHCPYCHGYEVRNEQLGVIANGDMGFEYARLIANWSSTLTLFTNGPSTLTAEQKSKIEAHHINIVEKEIDALIHLDGKLQHLLFKDGSVHKLTAIFAKGSVVLHSDVAVQLGCQLHTEGMFSGLIKVDDFGKTTQPGIYAAGDNMQPLRSVASSVAAGNRAGALLSNELIREKF